MKLTLHDVDQIVRRKLDAKARANATSLLASLNEFGGRLGLDQRHRLAQFLAQVLHESGEFRYDREVWGPTAAQQRYDVRTDLGNTPERDGDGKLYMGRTGIQITGKANYAAFRDWCRGLDRSAPDFVKRPDVVNTDPWEGLGPLWYWSTRKLNRYADQGDVEMITKRINGGLNGYDDRLELLERASLVLLGFAPGGLRQFQASNGLEADGIFGPKSRAAVHAALLATTAKSDQSAKTAAAPVVDEKPVAVAPEQIDKPVAQTKGFWAWLSQLGGLGGLAGATWLGDWRIIAAIFVGLVVVAVLGLLLQNQLVAAVKRIKGEVSAS